MNLAKQEYIGKCELCVVDIIRNPKHIWQGNLQNPNRAKNGKLILKIEELDRKMSSDLVKIVIEGNMNKKAPYFFRLFRGNNETDELIPVYQSEGSRYEDNIAKWKTVAIGAAGLMRDDQNCPLALQLFEYRQSGSHVTLGNFKFTFYQLLDSKQWTGEFGSVIL